MLAFDYQNNRKRRDVGRRAILLVKIQDYYIAKYSIIWTIDFGRTDGTSQVNCYNRAVLWTLFIPLFVWNTSLHPDNNQQISSENVGKHKFRNCYF